MQRILGVTIYLWYNWLEICKLYREHLAFIELEYKDNDI